LVLIGLENLCIRSLLRAHRRGEYRPPIVVLSVGECLNLNPHTISHFGREGVGRRGTSPTRTARAACGGHDALADRMIAPGTWAAASLALPLALIRSYSSISIRQARNPLRLHPLAMLCHGWGFLRLCPGRRVGVLVRQLTRMHAHKPASRRSHPSLTVLDLHPAAHALSMPAAGCLVLRPPGLLDEKG